MVGNNKKINTIDITLIALMAVILFVQEFLLTGIPGVQLTVFLIILYSKKFGLFRSSIIILLHVLLDNFALTSFNVIFTPVMLLGWLVIPLTICTIFKRVKSSLLLGVLGIGYSFIYCWLYILPTCLLYDLNLIAYFIADFQYELIFACCSFISVFLLYQPCSKAMDILINRTNY